MNRALRFAPWLFTACALVLAVTGSRLEGPVLSILLVTIGLSAIVIARSVNAMPWIFALAVLVSGISVVLFDANVIQNRAVSPSTFGMVVDLLVGVALLAILAKAIRLRRGHLDERDVIDLVTVALGSALAVWIVVTSRLIFIDDMEPLQAVGATLFMPIAALLFTFIVDLLFTGLRSNRTMQLIAGAAGVNVVAAMASAFTLIGLADLSHDNETALFASAFTLLCAGLAHSDAPGILAPDGSARPAAMYTPLRLTLTGACLIVPGVLVASLAPFDRFDAIVRVAFIVALVCSVVVRLFVAVRSHEGAHDELVSRLHLDDLTKLPTRARFVSEVEDVLEATWRSEFQPTIIQLNLDRFKNINDSLGHYEANEVLVIVADRLNAAATAYGGVVARSGGDDFVIIDATTTSADDAMERLEAVREVLAAPFRVGDGSLFVSASFGVAVAPRNRTISAEEFMRRADIATHEAKAAGRGKVAVFDDSMQAHLAHRMDVEHALHGAIGRQEMQLYHQPIVDIRTGTVTGFESLIRWQRDGVIVPPGDFITIAEETGIIRELGAWALHEALGELRGWIDDAVVDPATTISVNVSPRQIADPDFAAVVRDALEATGVPAHLLWLEMTESMMLEEPELAESTLREIRDMGVRLALDDFGTGYSSLSLLQQFPIQRIKIDRAFVNGIAEQGNDRSLVRTIIAMAQSMALDLVAEGVETVYQLEVLRELACDKAQGYLISRPVPPDAMRSTMVALDELTSLSMFGSQDGDPTARETPRVAARIEEPIEHHAASMAAVVGSVSSRPLGQPVL
ncbi:putative bifunctional diguanylate cyclase/phosphodiesterase [Ilumatobacter sp.]|uniref:putative bifunctional diguanylate cyclase/phosphodiesterase n=1 Tax=Ilumatobacter sp. TaxID=1967498 RepID=UPI003AF8BBD6